MKRKYIKKFIFDKAQYYVGDGNGNEVLLKINYYNKTYRLHTKTKITDQKFENDLKGIAEELLERKHGKNFASNVSLLK